MDILNNFKNILQNNKAVMIAKKGYFADILNRKKTLRILSGTTRQ